MEGACHCGTVRLAVPGRPEYLNQCNCTACWKLGTLWGYYPAEDVQVAGTPASYRRTDAAEPSIQFNFCSTCGAVTHWSPTGVRPIARFGVNMRLFDPDALAGVEVRYGDRRRHDAVEPRHYARAPTLFGAGGTVA